jgi:hypothetical protein
MAAMTNRTDTQQTTADTGTADLEKLAAELDGKAYAVTLVTAAGRRPCLKITNRQAAQLTDFIYAAPADDGESWFWWGWAQQIAPVTDLAGAAAAVDRVLRILGEPSPSSRA